MSNHTLSATHPFCWIALLAFPAGALASELAPIVLPPAHDEIYVGVDRGGIEIGRITGLSIDGVIVGGVDFSLGAAHITRDGANAGPEVLAPGQQVSINALLHANNISGTALSVTLDHRLRGPVGTVDSAADQFSALGQPVRVDADTAYGGITALAELSAGDFVLVSGHVASDGQILATRVEVAVAESFSIEGQIAEALIAENRFRINSQWVDYSAAELQGIAVPAVGDAVEVFGDTLSGNNELLATSVGLDEIAATPQAGDFVSMEGLLLADLGDNEYLLGGLAFRIDAATEFENGSSADLQIGAHLEVHGIADASGTAVAGEVEFVYPSNVEIEAAIQYVDPQNKVIKVLGIKVRVDSSSWLEDDSDLDLQPFSFSDLYPGDRIVLNASWDMNQPGRLLARALVRERPDTGIALQGPVTAIDIANATITVLGVRILTNPSNPDIIEFFDRIQIGDRVQANGIQIGSNLMFATEVKPLDDDLPQRTKTTR